MAISRQKAAKLPQVAGVYLFRNKKGEVLYVGKSTNLRERVKSHISAKGEKSRALLANSSSVGCIPVTYELEALLLEAELIKKYLPRYNSRAKDDKHPLYIKITGGEFPKVVTSRREREAGATYFGPFPRASTTREVLRDLRKIFPFCSQKRTGKKPCFYSHLGLCKPCPAAILKVRNNALRKKLKRQYRQNIRGIIMVLSGKIQKLVEFLRREMVRAAKTKHFEEAAQIRDQIKGLTYVTTPYISPGVYLEHPGFIEELRKNEITALRGILSPWFQNDLRRIEYLDVAHIAGEAATASLVTFLNGEPEKSLYRRFKIQTRKTQDDFSMMQEVVKRRLKHCEDWGMPDLLVVDGGKPQVSAAKSVLGDISLPVVGFAKRFEEIVLHSGGRFHIVRLKVGEPALNLLRRLEHEAHRFARAYHFKLRLKKVLET